MELHSVPEIKPELISAQALKADSETLLQRQLNKAVITCPAYFAAPEVENTRKAGELAGFEVLQIVREPVAAAVYYGVDNLAEGQRMLVYDLGGGTFDATILRLDEGSFHVLATLGDRQLGGHDWTTDLLEYVSRQLSSRFGQDPRDDPTVHQALYIRCETAKRDLSQLDRVTIACTFQDKVDEVTIDRKTFEGLTERRLLETVSWCNQTLAKAQPPLTWEEIDKILLVGGSTRLRRVTEALTETSGKAPIRTGEVDTMVALGAAVVAKGKVRRGRTQVAAMPGSLSPSSRPQTGIVAVSVKDSCPRNLGTRVIVWDNGSPKIENSVIIPYGTSIPTEKCRADYTTAAAGQSHFDVPMVEFDNMGPDAILKTYRFGCVPNKRAKSRISVTFRYDRSGQVDVEARDLNTNQPLGKERIDYAQPDLSGLKLTSEPRCVIFAVDVSGSMGGTKLTRAKDALLSVTGSLLGKGPVTTKIGIATFSSTVTRLCELTASFAAVESAVASMSASGSTRMDQAIRTAVEMFGQTATECQREIALITDGMADSADSALRAARAAAEAGVKISAVGIGSEGVDEEFLNQVASGVLMIDHVDQLAEALPALLIQNAKLSETTITWGRK